MLNINNKPISACSYCPRIRVSVTIKFFLECFHHIKSEIHYTIHTFMNTLKKKIKKKDTEHQSTKCDPRCRVEVEVGGLLSNYPPCRGVAMPTTDHHLAPPLVPNKVADECKWTLLQGRGCWNSASCLVRLHMAKCILAAPTWLAD